MKNWIIGILVVGAAWFFFVRDDSVSLGPGVFAPSAPQQRQIVRPEVIEIDGFWLTPLATFQMEGKVLSKKHYRWGKTAALAPIDLAMGWGAMSDESVLEHIDISQSGRWYHWSAKELPIASRTVELCSANMHMIPADDEVRDALDDVREGQIIDIDGYLVRVDGSDGYRWESSLNRTDTGDGACEIIYLKSIQIREFSTVDGR